jgi:hypothetical protein
MSHSDELTPSRVQLPLPTVCLIAILGALGLALIFQSARWSRTPAYGNLMLIFPAHVWGYIYLAAAVLTLIGLMMEIRAVSVAGHTLSFILLGMWTGAFVVRWITDSSTTIANVVAWTAYFVLVIRSGGLLKRSPTE